MTLANAVAGNFHLATSWERLSTFISTYADTGSFDSASASLCEAAAALRMTLFFLSCTEKRLNKIQSRSRWRNQNKSLGSLATDLPLQSAWS